jgi:hypothetical protein
MSRIVTALLLTLSLVAGQGGLVGFKLGIPLSAHMFSARTNVLAGEERRDVGGRPRHGCCQVACTQTLCVPERYALVHDVQPAPRLLLKNDHGPYSAIVWREPPVPRVLIG